MGNNSLKDLVMSGVVWELSDGKGQKAKGNYADTLQTKTNIQDKPALCPMPSALPAATAPVAPDSASIVANEAGDIDSLLAAVAAFDHPLKQFAKNTVLPDIQGKGQKAKGNSALLVITDSPSLDDDETGQILSGPAGDLFDKMIGAINLTRADLSIMPLVFWRAPGGRTPAREELDLCRPFVSRAIELLQPKAILTL
ncbi:MAG: uracil-DNA glycosylase, partial [Rickettsiales bacterium]|nr:uracil-DNA glycosylase [Rickettsiales bacterium]